MLKTKKKENKVPMVHLKKNGQPRRHTTQGENVLEVEHFTGNENIKQGDAQYQEQRCAGCGNTSQEQKTKKTHAIAQTSTRANLVTNKLMA
jgi:hypothetical protein